MKEETAPMNRLRRAFVCLTALSATLVVAPAFSQSPTDGKSEEKWLIDRKLTVSATAPVPPEMQFRFLPLAPDMKEGNAVPIYLRLVHEQSDASRKRWIETPKPWNELPIDRVPLAEAKQFLGGFSYFLEQLDWGARSKVADWNYTIRPGHVIELLLPDIQNMRGYVPLMVLRARVALAENRFEDAAQALETGFSFSRQITEAPFLISALVGIACARQFADCVTDWQERPGSPNVYWALTALPQPLIDMRKAFDYEYRVMELEFPDLADLDRPRTAAQWNAVLKHLREKIQWLGQVPAESSQKQKEWQPAGTRAEDPADKSPDLAVARKYLTERMKLTADSVAQMPPAQILLVAMKGICRDLQDDFFKSTYLPYVDARRVLDAAEHRMKAAPESELNLLSRLLLPSTFKALTARVRLDRQITALRVIEAIRAHAKTHGGQLPETLSQITDVPVPLDPGTGQPFEYRKSGSQATLISRLPGEPNDRAGFRYTISIRQ
jgi:hypothetical protein